LSCVRHLPGIKLTATLLKASTGASLYFGAGLSTIRLLILNSEATHLKKALKVIQWLRSVSMTDRKGELLVRAGKGEKQRVIPLNNSARKSLNA
jgi:hypothetical protein